MDGVKPLASAPAAAESLKAAILTAAVGRPARMAVELTRDDKLLPIDVRLTPITDAQGRVVHVLPAGRFDAWRRSELV